MNLQKISLKELEERFETTVTAEDPSPELIFPADL